VNIGGVNVLCDECPLRPKIVDEAFAPKAGDLYSPTQHDKSLRRLASYNTFRYISMSYDPVPGADSLLTLNAYMQPRLRRRFEGEFGLTYNNARYFGPNLKLTYLNRNLLRGAELLRLEGDFSYAISSGSDVRVPRSGIYGLTASLEIPRLWMPKRRKLIPRVITSGTVISLGGKLEDLSLRLTGFASEIATDQLNELADLAEADENAQESVRLLQLSGKYGYTWQRRIAKSHALYPFNIRYQDPQVSTPQLLDLTRTLGVSPGAENGASRFDRMIVFSPNYVLTYDDRKKGLKTHNIFWQQSVAMSFNTIFPVGTQALVRSSERSIYPQIETDLRYYLTLNKRQQFAARLHVGAAIPITDRAIVPYFDLYSIGGPNSLRGFSPRELGPGRSAPQGNNLLSFGGFGNALFETSVEFRQRINSMIEIAPFFDAGNIWTYRSELTPLNTDFTTATFFDELAMNAGLGFRFDLQFLILRIDLAKPLRVPSENPLPDQVPPFLNAGEPVDKSLRMVLAFGYPF
jgi:outer membrane protein assembly factor BamA